MSRLKNKIGMTIAEMLIVVGIIAILGGVSFIGVQNYRRSMGQLERDGIAKEIFVAAQNHLTAAYGEGYLGLTGDDSYGILDEKDDYNKGVYYFVVDGSISDNTVLSQMLPFGSIDETVRLGGSYIIRYQKDTGLVLDVFYCTKNGSPTQFNDTLAEDETEYAQILNMRGSDKKQARRNWNGKGAILGWYGGDAAAQLPTLTLEVPTISVTNGETLSVEITDPNIGESKAALKLIVTGNSRGAQIAFELPHGKTGKDGRVEVLSSGKYKVTLDDITEPGMRFQNINKDIINKADQFIPGENITIQAVAYSNLALANVAYSTKATTNSLFASIGDSETGGVYHTAFVGAIRHLENLDENISALQPVKTDATGKYEQFNITAAKQTTDLRWKDFKTWNDGDDRGVYYGDANFNAEEHTTNSYYPISPEYALTYDGQNHSILGVVVTGDGDYSKDAGLFGSVTANTEIRNLELIDFNITGRHSAGALAGDLKNCTVTNVLARNSSDSVETKITAKAGNEGSAGGLIGIIEGGSVTNSAAALIVDGSVNAGGLIGKVDGTNTVTVSGCYSGGHTVDLTEGAVTRVGYSNTNYNVKGDTTAGGLIGDAGSAVIEYSYSTCSVSGTTAGGGFVGSAGGTLTNCYCTGLVSGDNAFIGNSDSSPSISNCYYYQIVNEVLTKDGSGNITEITYKEPGNAGVTPFDATAKSFNDFVGSDRAAANAYNATLRKYYAGKYNLPTVAQLGTTDSDSVNVSVNDYVATHYGDWPAPELFFINESSTGTG